MVKTKWSKRNARFMMKGRIKKIGFYTVVIIIIFSGQFLMNQGLKTGEPPVIKQQTISGLNAMQKVSKGPAIIYFWAEWCGICNMMQTAVTAIAQDYPVITVAVKSGSADRVKSYLADKALNWEVVNDPLGEIAEQYQTRGVPSVFFIDENNEIVLTATGYTSEVGLRLRLWLIDVF